MHDPRPLKFLFNSPGEDKKRLSAIIGRMIPYRIGIEFELFGTLSNLVPKDCDATGTYLKKKFNLRDYSEDMYRNWSVRKEDRGELNEIRISIEGVKQLNSLWNVLLALRENCRIPLEKGGIHIHIDFSEPISRNLKAKDLAKEYFNRKDVLDRVINIFGGYKGKYNSRGCGIGSKHYWINISNKNSIEFRIGKLNFDYMTIIRWIVELSKLVTEAGRCVPVKATRKLTTKLDEGEVRQLPEEILFQRLDVVNDYIDQVSNRMWSIDDYGTVGTTSGRYRVYDSVTNNFIGLV